MTTKYKIEYRLFTKEPLLTASTNHVFSAVKIFNEPLEFCALIADFCPAVCEDIVNDFVERNPSYAGKTFWVQQNAYRLAKGPFEGRICFAAYRVDHFPAE